MLSLKEGFILSLDKSVKVCCVQTFCKHEQNEPFPDTLNDEGVEVWSELVDDVFCFIFQYASQVWQGPDTNSIPTVSLAGELAPVL